MLRHYISADADMRQQLRTMYGHYLTNQAAFQAFSPEFDAAFATHWLAALDLADTTPTHAVRVGELKENTAAVETVMSQAQQAVQALFYFVGRAFPHNAGRLDQYGRRTYAAARDDHDKMRTLLQTAFTAATHDHAELAAKGYGATQLAALGTLAGQLTATNTTQEIKKGSNTEGADHYVTVQNLAYGFGQQASAAAKVLFATDATKLKTFRLSATAPTGPEHHELTVAPGHKQTVTFHTPFDPTSRLHLRLATVLEAGQHAAVGRVVLPDEKPTLTLDLAPATPELEASLTDLGPVGQVLVVLNTGEQPVRVELRMV